VTQRSYVVSGMEVDYLIFQLTDITVLTWGKHSIYTPIHKLQCKGVLLVPT
jgi:hypothetical protein